MRKLPRLYLALMANALIMVGVILFEIWTGGSLSEDLFVKIIGTGLTMGLFMSFVAIFRMDFASLESRTLGYGILGLAMAIETLIILAIWEIWVPDTLFLKIGGTLGVLLALAFYILSLKEDLLRERRQKKDGFLD